MRRSLLLLLIALYSLTAVAERTIRLSGKVTDTSGEAIVGARLSLSTKEGTQIAFAFSTKGGAYKIETKKALSEESLTLTISHVSYERREIAISTDRETQTLDIILRDRGHDLREVTVTAPPITQRSDTLTYLLEAFKGMGDYTLEDAIKRLPGIEVDPKGQIKYLGQAISHFYIEGMDLLGGKYRKVTKTLEADKVATVDLLRHHQDRKMDKDEPSNQVALNVHLKEEAKLHPSWSGYGALGYEKRLVYDGLVTGMLFGKQAQIVGQLGGGSYEERARFDLMDLIYGGGGPSAMAETLLGRLTDHGAPLDREQYIRPLDVSTSFDGLRKLSEDREIKIQASYGESRAWHDYSIARAFADGTEINEQRSPFALDRMPSLEMEYKDNAEEHYLSNTVKLQGTITRDEMPTLLNQVPYTPTGRSSSLGLSERLYYSFKRNGLKHRLDGLLGYATVPQNEIVIPTPGAATLMVQQARGSHYDLSGTYRLSNSGSKHLIGGETTITYSGDHAETYRETGGERSSVNDLHLSDLSLLVTGDYTYTRQRGRKLVVKAALPIQVEYLRIENLGDRPIRYAKPFVRLSPRLSLDYALSPFSEIRLESNLSNSRGGASSFLTAPIRTGLTRQTKGEGHMTLSRQLTLAGRYKYSQPVTMWFGSLDASYTRGYSNTIASQDISEGRIDATGERGDLRTSNYSLNGSITKRFHAYKSAIGLDGGVSGYRSGMIQNGQLLPFATDSYYIGPDLRLTLFYRLELSYRYNLSLSRLRSAGTTSLISTQSHRGSLRLQITPNLLWTTSARALFNKGYRGERDHFTRLDSELTYQLRSVRLTLSVNNLLDQQTYRHTIFDAINTYTYDYQLRPRSIVLSLTTSL